MSKQRKQMATGLRAILGGPKPEPEPEPADDGSVPASETTGVDVVAPTSPTLASKPAGAMPSTAPAAPLAHSRPAVAPREERASTPASVGTSPYEQPGLAPLAPPVSLTEWPADETESHAAHGTLFSAPERLGPARELESSPTRTTENVESTVSPSRSVIREPRKSTPKSPTVTRTEQQLQRMEQERLQRRVGTIDQPYLRQRDNQQTRKVGVVLSVEVADRMQIHCVMSRQRTNVFIEQAIIAALDAQRAPKNR